jgi:hypothetical protein
MSGSSLASAASSTHPSTAVSSPIELPSEKPNLPKIDDDDADADGNGSNMQAEGQKEEQQNEVDPEADDEEGMDLKAKALTKLLKTSSVRALPLQLIWKGDGDTNRPGFIGIRCDHGG